MADSGSTYLTFPDDKEDGAWGEPYKFESDFAGPTKRRSCTDVACLALFLVFVAGWGYVAYVAVHGGNINKVLFPTDSRGEICGRGELSDRPLLLFFDLTKCLNPAVLVIGCRTPQVCVSACPSEQYSAYAAASSCDPASPSEEKAVKTRMRPTCAPMSEADWTSKSALRLIEEELCPAWVLPSSNVLGRCLPTLVNKGEGSSQTGANATVVHSADSSEGESVSEAALTTAVAALGAFLQLRSFGERVFNDLAATWWMIGLAFVAACVVSFLWIVLMRFFAGFMVRTSVGLVLTLFGGLFGYSLYRYISLKDLPSAQGNIFTVNFTPDYGRDLLAQANTWLALTVVLGIVLVVILLVLIAIWRRILIAIELIEEASRAVAQLFVTMFFPLFPFALHVGVVVMFSAVALYLASAGTPEHRIAFGEAASEPSSLSATETAAPMPAPCACLNPQTNEAYLVEDLCDPAEFNATCTSCPGVTCQFTKYVRNADASWMQVFNLFGLYWGLFFASALGELILAGVFSTWYWTWDKSDVACCGVLVRWVGIAVFYHAGTVAFGSLILAIVRFLRTVLHYIESRLKRFNNDLAKCLLCVCACCLWCLERFIRFVNRNAYIVCAMRSTGFCASAKDAFHLLMRNYPRVVVLNKVVSFVLFLGEVVVVASVGFLAYFVFSGDIPAIRDDVPTLNYFQAPIVVVLIGSYLIAASFFAVYSMAVDTLFVCFLEDLERNDGSPARPYFMSMRLMRIVGKMQKFNEEQSRAAVEREEK